MTELVRFAIIHDLEAPDQRLALGKNRKGKLTLSAERSHGQVFIHVKSDGSGIDAEQVRRRAQELGMSSMFDRLGPTEIFNGLFFPGFYLEPPELVEAGFKTELPLVKQSIDEMRGSIEFVSSKKAGGEFIMTLPLTLALFDGLLVSLGDHSFVLPLSVIEECVEFSKGTAPSDFGGNFVVVRGELVPYVPLRETLHVGSAGVPLIEQVIICTIDRRKIGFKVDGVVGQLQTVIKPLGSYLCHANFFNGATILGNGGVALILNLQALATFSENAQQQQ